MYLHSRSEFEDYHTFFSHIAVKLRGCTEVRFGSDDDKAFVNAIEDCLVQSGVLGIHVLCACHLRNNVKDHLQDMVGLSKSDCDKFLNIIFGEQGLCKKCHEQLFDQKCEDILASVQDSVLHTYLQATIMPKLKKKVMQPMWLHGTNPDWTNNSESGNHVMKLVAGWKPQQLLDLVDMLHSLTQQQFGEVVKVFAGRGDFALAERYLQYNMDHQVWASKSRDAQQRHVKKFIEARKPAPTPGTTRSIDGKLLINVKKTAGKKPHQKQRPKAIRTRTISQSNK